MEDILQSYTNFNLWANTLILDFIEKNISEEERQKEITSSFPSVMKTVCHLWDAEFIWMERLQGRSPSTGPGSKYSGKFADAKDEILRIDRSLIDYVKNNSGTITGKTFSYKTIDGTAYTSFEWQAILHDVNHSSFHRGQLITMFRQLKKNNLPSTDFIRYTRENK